MASPCAPMVFAAEVPSSTATPASSGELNGIAGTYAYLVTDGSSGFRHVRGGIRYTPTCCSARPRGQWRSTAT